MSACHVEGCASEVAMRLWCWKHYQRWRRHGDPERLLIEERGNGSIDSLGYRRVSQPDHPLAYDTGVVFEHRVVLYDAIGPGVHPCHWCNTPVTWEVTADEARLVVDHLDDDRLNNVRENLVASCNSCNSLRGKAC